MAGDDPVGIAAGLAASGLPVVGRVGDLRSPDDLASLVAWTVAEFGRIDTLSANAGLSTEDHPLGLTPDEQFDLMLDVHVRGNIRANALAPGVIETGFAKAITEGELREARLAKAPLHRFGRVADIAGTVLYLASAAGSFTTGQTIVVDGGALISD